MSDAQIKNKITKSKKSSRRSKKKRRTEDFSSDSSSSSDSSDSENESKDTQQDTTKIQQQQQQQQQPNKEDDEDELMHDSNDLNIDGLNLPKLANSNITIDDLDNTKLNLRKIDNLTNLTQIETGLINNSGKINLNSSKVKINETREVLLNTYLTKMLNNYGDDLDELRQKKDFNGSISLNLLAKLLKESGNIFDDEILKNLVDN
ncbi:hypothetical protein CANARDRAFT_20958 [[Candida] arabinofermentans NRRL YB-2248]|uniref:Ribosome assembly protein 3 n=1 Tax=[Candida] arabinofermentans NRRL YB-2248 TaxID=983967 RepID=A0A1E4T913_9ASCO|nr:hypothetical protein CANARDRAFT_20958 [[Candida] arabinofermentans NRRL YB-2248]